jgi:hypothetical protein
LEILIGRYGSLAFLADFPYAVQDQRILFLFSLPSPSGWFFLFPDSLPAGAGLEKAGSTPGANIRNHPPGVNPKIHLPKKFP